MTVLFIGIWPKLFAIERWLIVNSQNMKYSAVILVKR